MKHFCTLFDINYAAKGIALYQSLKRHSSEEFTLHILCMDSETFWLLAEMELDGVELISVASFEQALKLEPVRESRSWAEYCWTCASSLMEYLLPWHESITYLDADIFFFSDPKVIYEEISDASIGIVPHRFNAREQLRLGANGNFNVGVVFARSNGTGLACISQWAAKTREWCFAKVEGAKFGDQAYLDSWPADYGEEVCVIENFGVNLGPWSIANFEVWIRQNNAIAICKDPICYELVAYHFHEFESSKKMTGWRLRQEDIELIYTPYIQAFNEAIEEIRVYRALIDMRKKIAAQQMTNA